MDLISRVVIVGGDVIAPMVAAAMANSLRGQTVAITLIRGAPAAGGAHSALPQTANFHKYLGLDHLGLLRRSNATFKLGVDYTGWVQPGRNFLHPFGAHGATLRLVPFHHYYVKQLLAGEKPDFDSHSLAAIAAKQGKFTLPSADGSSILSTFAYSIHVDAAEYAALFQDLAGNLGVNSLDGAVAEVGRRTADGFIDSVTLSDGRRIDGDLFIDCSGPRSLLLGDALGQEFLDWSSYLPCDRSLSLSVTDVPELSPLTFTVAKKPGWSRRIPMRDRSDYEFFYNSRFIDDDQARALLQRDLGRATSAEPRRRRFANGRRRRFWHKNCIAIGGAAGFVEPLESSNLHLAQSAVLRLMGLFPDRSCNPAKADEYNRLTGLEYANILDFVALFYASVKRDDSDFWEHCRSLQRPDSLAYRLELFRSHGRLAWHDEETFPKEYWVSALIGLGHTPESYDPLADVPGEVFVADWLVRMRNAVSAAARDMPTHEAFIAAAD